VPRANVQPAGPDDITFRHPAARRVVGGWRFDGRPYGREGGALLVAPVARPADC